jgi:hypothetical protein
VLGADRIVFSTDYPFEAASLGGARDFLASAELSELERNLIANGNWDRLRAGIARKRGGMPNLQTALFALCDQALSLRAIV